MMEVPKALTLTTSEAGVDGIGSAVEVHQDDAGRGDGGERAQDRCKARARDKRGVARQDRPENGFCRAIRDVGADLDRRGGQDGSGAGGTRASLRR